MIPGQLNLPLGTSAADQVIAIVEDQSGLEASHHSRLLEDLGLDSLDRIDLAIRVGEHFGFEIPDEDVDRPALGTVGGLSEYVIRRLAVAAQ